MRKKNPDSLERAARGDATLNFGVREPQLDSAPFISPPLRLHALRQRLSTFGLLHSKDPAGFNFDNFARNIRGLKYVEVGGRGFEILFTRTSAFLTFEGIPGILRSISDVTGNDIFSRINVAAGARGEMLTICRITGRELGLILGAAAFSSKGSFSSESFLPKDADGDISPADFANMLARCIVVSSDLPLDLAAFAKQISMVSVFHDEKDQGYFVMGLKDQDTVYALYVNTPVPDMSEQNPMVARLKYNRDSLTLFRMDVIG